VKNGKIVQIGKNITDASAKVIDGTGKHLTAGIIDEHSHIAAFSINEGGQSVTSEVRMGDNLDPDDIDIYRQLSGGLPLLIFFMVLPILLADKLSSSNCVGVLTIRD
jgi:imidazolonepropionase-like amidohydrolase